MLRPLARRGHWPRWGHSSSPWGDAPDPGPGVGVPTEITDRLPATRCAETGAPRSVAGGLLAAAGYGTLPATDTTEHAAVIVGGGGSGRARFSVRALPPFSPPVRFTPGPALRSPALPHPETRRCPGHVPRRRHRRRGARAANRPERRGLRRAAALPFAAALAAVTAGLLFPRAARGNTTSASSWRRRCLRGAPGLGLGLGSAHGRPARGGGRPGPGSSSWPVSRSTGPDCLVRRCRSPAMNRRSPLGPTLARVSDSSAIWSTTRCEPRTEGHNLVTRELDQSGAARGLRCGPGAGSRPGTDLPTAGPPRSGPGG